MTNRNTDQQNSDLNGKVSNQLRRDGFAAVVIALIAAVLIFVMFKHFVS